MAKRDSDEVRPQPRVDSGPGTVPPAQRLPAHLSHLKMFQQTPSLPMDPRKRDLRIACPVLGKKERGGPGKPTSSPLL
jgi:hypothetical protein